MLNTWQASWTLNSPLDCQLRSEEVHHKLHAVLQGHRDHGNWKTSAWDNHVVFKGWKNYLLGSHTLLSISASEKVTVYLPRHLLLEYYSSIDSKSSFKSTKNEEKMKLKLPPVLIFWFWKQRPEDQVLINFLWLYCPICTFHCLCSTTS